MDRFLAMWGQVPTRVKWLLVGVLIGLVLGSLPLVETIALIFVGGAALLFLVYSAMDNGDLAVLFKGWLTDKLDNFADEWTNGPDEQDPNQRDG